MVFCRTEPVGGPFADVQNPTTASLAFFRLVRSQNSYGEIVVSWVSNVTLTGDLQPRAGKFPRYHHGDVEETRAVFVVLGNPDAEEGDRCLISANQMEIFEIDRYGTAQAEIYLKWVRAHSSAVSAT